MQFLTPIVGVFVTEIWKPIKKHSRYCLKPGGKVRYLAEVAHDLEDTIDNIDEKIQSGELEGKRPRVQATEWIDSARSVKDESYKIKNVYEQRSIHSFGCSWNCFFNYKISSAAAKKKCDADKLKSRIPQNDNIFSVLPPIGRELPLPPNIVGQNQYKEDIIGYIKQGTRSFIGICAMGGSGKTTLLKQLNNSFSCAAEMHDFDHVIYVEVNQQYNLDTVQQNIASQLGLMLGQDESTTSRSASLCNFLEERKFLLLIDNLWEALDLVKVGIPQGFRKIGPRNRQMIIITTRSYHVCHSMQAHCQVIKLQRLPFDESWSLFQAHVGYARLTSSSAQIKGYAKSIVEKCGGLPLALKIVGQAMASKECEHEWEHVVMLLQQSQFHKVPDADDLYSVLYISYEHLPDERARQCFLFFALTAVPYNCTPVSHVILLWMGHGLLDEDDNIRSNFLRGHSVVGCLKRACLIEEHSRGDDHLSRHDIVRDLALWIVAKQQGGRNKKWLLHHYEKSIEPEEWKIAERIFLLGKSDVMIPDPCSCPPLLTLSLKRTGLCKVPTGFFLKAPSLTYLDLSVTTIQEIPSDVGALVNLQHLDISKTLIRSLPVGLQLLKKLMYLYIRWTHHLATIPDETISALSMLRVLDLYQSAYYFPEDKTQAYFEELESLAWLQYLGITVGNRDSLGRIFNLSKASLQSLHIRDVEDLQCFQISPSLISKTRANQLETLALSGLHNLQDLVIGETEVDSAWHFQKLDELRLIELQRLKGITWKEVVPHALLPKLRRLQIFGCHNIKTITWIKQLPCLVEVYLGDCDSMSELVNDDEGDLSSATVVFPQLKVLGLINLRNLQIISDGRHTFPCFQRLLVYKCPMLASLPSKLLDEDRFPLILGELHWWEQLCWEDAIMKPTLCSFFRELHASFRGDYEEMFRALFTSG